MFAFLKNQFYCEQQEQYREYCETGILSCLHGTEYKGLMRKRS